MLAPKRADFLLLGSGSQDQVADGYDSTEIEATWSRRRITVDGSPVAPVGELDEQVMRQLCGQMVLLTDLGPRSSSAGWDSVLRRSV